MPPPLLPLPKILAFGHQKNVGKDQFVKFCFDLMRPRMSGRKLLRRGFADKLYHVCYNLYGWAGFKTLAYYQDKPSAKADRLDTGKTVRETLIEVGNKLREFDSDVWINANLRDDSADLLFITDVRYPNEFLQIQAAGGYLVKITRPGLPVPTDVADTALNDWDSKWNLTINNDGDLPELYLKAEAFVSQFFPPAVTYTGPTSNQ